MNYQTYAPWGILKGQDSGCMCLTCENLHQIWCGQLVAEKWLRYIILKLKYELIANTKK